MSWDTGSAAIGFVVGLVCGALAALWGACRSIDEFWDTKGPPPGTE